MPRYICTMKNQYPNPVMTAERSSDFSQSEPCIGEECDLYDGGRCPSRMEKK